MGQPLAPRACLHPEPHLSSAHPPALCSRAPAAPSLLLSLLRPSPAKGPARPAPCPRRRRGGDREGARRRGAAPGRSTRPAARCPLALAQPWRARCVSASWPRCSCSCCSCCFCAACAGGECPRESRAPRILPALPGRPARIPAKEAPRVCRPRGPAQTRPDADEPCLSPGQEGAGMGWEDRGRQGWALFPGPTQGPPSSPSSSPTK